MNIIKHELNIHISFAINNTNNLNKIPSFFQMSFKDHLIMKWLHEVDIHIKNQFLQKIPM